MRPRSIELFEKAFFTAYVIGLVNMTLNWSQLVAMLDDPRMRAAGMGSGALTVSVLIGFLVPLLLWYFVARRASNVAKWIFVALTALGVFGVVSSIANPLAPKGLMLVGTALTTTLNLFATWLLFRPDAKAWLERKGVGVDEPEVAD